MLVAWVWKTQQSRFLPEGFGTDEGLASAPNPGLPGNAPIKDFMTENSTTDNRAAAGLPGAETHPQRFERVLSLEPFKGLKAVLDSLRTDRAALLAEVNATKSYQELLEKLGYGVVLAPQIHVQDCYSRMGPAGGIRAVLPYHDMGTYSTLITLVNFDSTITTTPKSVSFFNDRLMELKKQLLN